MQDDNGVVSFGRVEMLISNATYSPIPGRYVLVFFFMCVCVFSMVKEPV